MQYGSWGNFASVNNNVKSCRLDRRRCSIMEAARVLFVEKGYEHTSLGDIVERSGGSLATVYKLFGNKDGLLEAVVFEKAASGEELIAEAVRTQPSPEATLHHIAEGLCAQFLDPDVVALVRVVIARSISDPEFARRFFERTATRTTDSLEQLFASWERAGLAMNGTARILAETFLELIFSDVHTEAISHGINVDHSPERLQARTEFFIAGAGIRNEASLPLRKAS